LVETIPDNLTADVLTPTTWRHNRHPLGFRTTAGSPPTRTATPSATTSTRNLGFDHGICGLIVLWSGSDLKFSWHVQLYPIIRWDRHPDRQRRPATAGPTPRFASTGTRRVGQWRDRCRL